MSERLNADEIRERLILLQKEYSQSRYQEAMSGSGLNVALFRISLLYRKQGVLVDLGGGLSAHNGILAQLGMTVNVLDLLSSYWDNRPRNPEPIDHEMQVLKSCGVQFINANLLTCDLTNFFPENSVDIVASFHCLEHLDRLPKILLRSAVRIVKPGGTLLIEVPNAANLRKRLGLLFGHTNYAPFQEYSDSPPYHYHIREYTVGDLSQLAQTFAASESYRIFGKNLHRGTWAERIPSFVRTLGDLVLQPFPGLCGSLFLQITKRTAAVNEETRLPVCERADTSSHISGSHPQPVLGQTPQYAPVGDVNLVEDP
jgi:SAM-dependent methyltransferase